MLLVRFAFATAR